MNVLNIPKRFGLKYSPKPLIAVEYEMNGPDPELRVLEVSLRQLSPSKYDVDGVVHALQKTYPLHLGSDVVSTAQLESLVARLLEHGMPYLPAEYQSRGDETLAGEAHKTSPTTKSSIQGERISYDHSLGDSDDQLKVPIPTSTPKEEHGGLSDDNGALHGLGNDVTREGKFGDCGGVKLAGNDRLNEVRALSRYEDGVKDIAGIMGSNEESEKKEDNYGMPKANQTVVDIHRQSEAKAESQKGERLRMACSRKHAESQSIMVNGSSATGLQSNRDFSKDESGSEVEEDIPEEVYDEFDDFEEDESVDNIGGDKEQLKLDGEAQDTGTTEERRRLNAEAITLDARLQISDVSLTPPAPPPWSHRDSLKAVPSKRGESSAAPSSFTWSDGPSKQPSSSTEDLTTQPSLGMPLPPLLGSQQKFDVLGNLPPASRRGLPSLDEAAAANGKLRNADISQRAATPLSSRRFGSGVAVSTHDSDLMMVSSTPQCLENSKHETNSASVGRATNELASGDLRLRISPGLSDEDIPENEKVGVITTLESPKQHQGQEEEAAGRRLESEVDDGSESVIGSRSGGERQVAGYFADSDAEGEIGEGLDGDDNSFDDSISFERESVNDADFFS